MSFSYLNITFICIYILYSLSFFPLRWIVHATQPDLLANVIVYVLLDHMIVHEEANTHTHSHSLELRHMCNLLPLGFHRR